MESRTRTRVDQSVPQKGVHENEEKPSSRRPKMVPIVTVHQKLNRRQDEEPVLQDAYHCRRNEDENSRRCELVLIDEDEEKKVDECKNEKGDGNKSEKVDGDKRETQLENRPGFSLPNNLYGRQAEKRMLQAAYHRRCHEEGTASELVLITGKSGTGKTALARSLQETVHADGGYFLSGKFDQLQGPEPYAPFVAAFTTFAELVDSRETETMKKCVQEAVDRDGSRLLVETIPALETILGLRGVDKVDVNTRTDVQKRCFLAAFQKFVRAVCSPKRPLVLFLDDLQWTDQCSLCLFSVLAKGKGNDGFMLLGACRGNEVATDDSLAVLLRDLEDNQIVITTIKVSNFSQSDVHGIVSQFLMTDDGEKLSEILYERSSGNIFTILRLLHFWQGDGVLAQDEHMKWCLDESRVGMKRSILDIMSERLQTLPHDVQAVLQVASCLGAGFHERLLRVVLSQFDVPAALIYALDEEMIDIEEETGVWNFTHDQMQEAAYALIPVDRRPSFHHSLGRRLWQGLSADELEENIGQIVNQLGMAVDVIQEPDERHGLALLSLRAGEKAVSSSAFGTAAWYFYLGIECLVPQHWQNQYELSLVLFNAAAEVEYCNAHYDDTNALLDELTLNARCFDDILQSYITRVLTLGSQGKYQEAIDTGFHFLEVLGGDPFPARPSKLRLLRDVFKTKWMLRGKSPDDILNLPVMESPERLASMRMLNFVSLYTYFSRMDLWVLVVNRIVQYTLLHGLSEMGCASFGFYGMMLCAHLGLIDEGYKYRQVALRLFERFNARSYIARVYTPVYACLSFWKVPVRDCLEPLQTAHRVGLETGDIEFAMVSSVAYIFLSFSAGLPLRLVFEEGCALAEEAKTHRQAGFHFLVHLTLLQMMSNLMGESEDPCVLTGEFMDENSFLKDATASKDEMVISAVYFRVQALAYYMGNFSLAAEAGRKSRSIRKLASIAMTQQWFFEGITATELARTSRKRSHMKVAHRSMRKMKKWAKHSPNNFLNRALLLEAELALLCGNRDTALKKYKQSIHLANDEGFLHDHALACERIGVALRHFGEERNAGEYFLKAVSSYREWGALAKVNQLEKVIESGG